MTRRYRLFAGLLASLSMTVSFAETVWASTCAPPAQTRHVSVADPVGDGAVNAEGTPSWDRSVHHDTDGSEHGHECPFSSPLAAQACAGMTALTSRPAPVPTLGVDVASEGSAVQRSPDLLPPRVPFRPPRA